MSSDAAKMEYRIVASSDEDGWLLRIPELSGCMAAADTFQEAFELLKEAKEAWIAAAENSGESIPRPVASKHDYSGKFTLRISRSLHRELAEKAEAEGVSLNQYCTHLLSGRVVETSFKSHIAETIETTMFEAYSDNLRMVDQPQWVDEQPITEQGGEYAKRAVVH